jgi:hypothetical protein
VGEPGGQAGEVVERVDLGLAALAEPPERDTPEPAWRSTIARPRFTGAPAAKPIARALSSQRKA